VKKERIYLLVAVDLYYDKPEDRAHMLSSAQHDVLACNTLPNEAKWSRVVRKPKPKRRA